MQKKRGNFLLGRQGFGLVDALAAMTIVSVATLGLSYSIVSSGKVRQTYENFLALQSAKSAIRASLRDPENYSAQVKAQLATGAVTPFTINFQPNNGTASPTGGPSGFAINSTGTFFLRKDQSRCAGFNDPNCFLRVDLDFQTMPGGGPGFTTRYQLNPSFQESMPPGDTQVSVRLPNELFKTTNAAICTNNVAVRGMDRDTGEVTCILPPPAGQSCPAGHFTKGLTLTPSGELTLNCGPPAQMVTCPNHYSIRSFSASQLEAGTKVGECLFTARSPTSHPNVYTGASIQGQACPPNYRLTTSCRPITVTANESGRCTKQCLDTTPLPPPLGPVIPGEPVIPPPPRYVDCSYNVPARAGSLINNSSANAENGYVDCRVQIPSQPRNPGDCDDWSPPFWAATTQLRINCELNSSTPAIVGVQ